MNLKVLSTAGELYQIRIGFLPHHGNALFKTVHRFTKPWEEAED